MQVSLSEIDRNDVVRRIDHSRCVCLLMGWSLDVLSDGGNPPASEGRRMELLEGASHVLNQTARGLKEIRERLVK